MSYELSVEIVWQDVHLVEIEVMACTDVFSGKTHVYTTYKDLKALAHSLEGFPKKLSDKVQFSAGEKNAYAYAGMSFYVFSSAGHTAALIEIEANTASNSREEERNTVQLELQFECSALALFDSQLRNMVEHKKGRASLKGIAPFTQNI